MRYDYRSWEVIQPIIALVGMKGECEWRQWPGGMMLLSVLFQYSPQLPVLFHVTALGARLPPLVSDLPGWGKKITALTTDS